MNHVLETLSGIQDKCIVEPTYITTQAHGQNSKEKDLRRGGQAYILTNSLAYDIFYCGEIAQNIFNGANYIYVLPHTARVMHQLSDFIEKLFSEFYSQTNSTTKTTELLQAVSFCILPEGMICLYNFAHLHQPNQGENQGFTESWWYIHAAESRVSDTQAPMMSTKITDIADQNNLDASLKSLAGTRGSNQFTGSEIHQHQKNLDSLFSKDV